MNPLALRLPLTAACILALAGTALGQNALGGGRALDGGLSTMPGGRINASTQDLQAIVKFNSNAGNALNGPGFTNRVPLGGSSSLTSSNTLGTSSGILNRSSTSTSSGYDPYGGFDRIAALEAGYMSQGALTSNVSLPQGTNVSDYARGAEKSVGYTRDRQGDFYIARSSSLRGLSVEPLPGADTPYDSLSTVPKTGTAATYGRVIDELRRASLARALENPNRIDNSAAGTATDKPPTPPGTPADAAKPAPGTDTANPTTPPSPNTPPANPDSPVAAKPTGGAAPVQYDPNATLKRLRDKLAAKPKEPVKTETARTTKPTAATAPDPSNAASTNTLTEEDINALRSMGLRLETLVPPGATDAQASDGYTRLGQEALATGRFGLADQMFQSALGRDPSNVLAKAGAVHATMGLGLLMTAGGDLRQYFVDHPEMIPVRFNDSILMPRARADRLAEMLIADIDRVDGPLLPNAGLTLAYLGRQFDNPVWLNKGFTAMGAQTKDDPQGTELLSILTRVWNAPDAPAKPAAAPRSVEPSK